MRKVNVMKTRLVILTLCVVSLLFGMWQLKTLIPAEEAFSKAIIKAGSKGADVRELQGRLKHLGFYNGSIDGDFGNRTLKSVKWFQSEFGLPVDGVMGAKSKLKLWEATKNWRPGQTAGGNQAQGKGAGTQKATNLTTASHLGYSDQDLKFMANAVYGEARGEPYEGQVAVAAVILNRVKSENFPNTPYGVIFEPRAFTAVADGQIWLEPNDSARRAVQDAINGLDPSGGCEYYFNPDTATSGWIWTRQQVKKIGKHIFAR
jgi:N-acetylmuramoyl-L-alanine amidase